MARDLVRLSYARLVQLAAERNVPVDYLERDYVLTVVLRQIARLPELGDQLVLKGGLALHHIYGSHRMSVDMDFTAERRLDPELLYDAIEAIHAFRIRMPQTIGPTRHSLTLTPVTYVGPRGVESHFEIEISYRELVILPPRVVPFASPFCDSFDVRVMPIEEIVAEKMRALYQRAKPGDLYDLFFILDSPTLNCDLEQTNRLLPTKFALVAGKWRRARFFKRLEERATQIELLWESALADVILGELPPFDETIATVRRRLRRLPPIVQAGSRD